MGMHIIAHTQVAINTNGSTAVGSAMLDISSTEKGLLVPRMSSAQRIGIDSPANGLLVFDTNTDSFWYFDESNGWLRLGVKVAGAEIINELDDAISDGTSIFVGAMSGANDETDNNNNTGLGIYSLNQNVSGQNNTAIGYSASRLNSAGNNNTSIGGLSLHNNSSGSENTAVGYQALVSNTTATGNVAVGNTALKSNTTGTNNVAIGKNASYFNTAGFFNTIVGYDADANNQTGNYNTILGYQAGRGSSQHSKTGNIFIGFRAGYNETGGNKLYIENSNSSSPLIGGDFSADEVYINGTLKITGGNPATGKYFKSDELGMGSWESISMNDLENIIFNDTSIFIGKDAGINDDGNNYNISMGASSLKFNTSGIRNTAIGANAMTSNTTGANNISFGNSSLIANISGSGNIAIGLSSLYNNTVGGSNIGVGIYSLGRNTLGENNIGIGYATNYFNEEGNNNTVIGYQAGKGNSAHNKSGNIFIGYMAGYSETGDNKLYIENSNSSSPLIGGDFNSDEVYFNGKVGIATSNPTEALEINGSLKITDGNQGSGKVIISDINGKCSWTDPSTLNDNDWTETSDSLMRISGSDTLLTITNSGNTGVGTTNPGATLDVAGHIWQTATGNSVFMGEEAGLNDDLSDNANVFIGKSSGKNNTIGEGNVAFSYQSLFSNTSGSINMAIGYMSLYSNTTGSFNNAIGYQTLASATTASNNIAIGHKSMYSNITGYSNIAIGSGTLYHNSSHNHSIAIGDSALYKNGSGANTSQALFNLAVGSYAMYENTIGSYNTATGTMSQQNNTIGDDNTSFGYNSMNQNSTGSNNTAIGSNSLEYNLTGNDNTAIGYSALHSLTSGSGNTSLGYLSGLNITTGNHNTTIGYKSYVESSSDANQLSICNFIYGTGLDGYETNISDGKIGLGVKEPNEILEVADKDNGHGRMIVSDAGGNNRYVLLFESPSSSDAAARIESYKYGSGAGGKTLEINTVGDAKTVFGGNVVPEDHKSEDLGEDGLAWDNVYHDDLINQGSASFTDRVVTEEIIRFPPISKKPGDFDYKNERGLEELDPASLPTDLVEDNGVLIDEMTNYNYKANYEQQLQINELKKVIEQQNKQIEQQNKKIKQLMELLKNK